MTDPSRATLRAVIYRPTFGREQFVMVVPCPGGCGDHVHRAPRLDPAGLLRTAPCGMRYKIEATPLAATSRGAS